MGGFSSITGFGDATIGVRTALNASVNKLLVFSSQGDILLSGGVPSSGTQGGNAVIGYYNQATTSLADIVFQNIQVASTSGNIALTGGNGTSSTTPNANQLGVAFIGTSTGTASGTQAVSNVTVQAPLGSLSLSGAPFNNSISNYGVAAISNATHQNFAVPANFDISLDVGRLLLTGTYQGATPSQTGSTFIGSARNIDVKTAGDLILVAGSGSANILNGFGVMNFDIGGNLELTGGSNTGAFNPFAQIGSPFGTGGIQNDLVFKNVGGDVILTSGTQGGGTAGFALIGHGSPGAGPIVGQLIMDHVGGNTTLNSLGSFAQIGHVATSSSVTGDVLLNQVDGIVQINAGVIGHQATSAGAGQFAGQVLVQARGVALGGTSTTVGHSTIGFDSASIVTSSQIQVLAIDGITLNGGTAFDATIGIRNASSATISKVNVSSQNGDIVLTGGTSFGTGGNAVVGYLNTVSTAVTIGELGVASAQGNITLAGSPNGGAAFIGTLDSGTNTQSQVAINAPFGALSLTGANSSGTAGRALIATNQLGSSAPVDLSVTVNRSILTGSPVAGTNLGIAEFFAGRNVSFVSSGDLQLRANSGSSAIRNGNGQMTFSVGGNAELIAGTGPAQIGNADPVGVLSSSILFNTVGGNALLQGGTAANTYAQIGHVQLFGGSPLTGNVQLNHVVGGVTLTSGTLSNTQAQIGHNSTNQNVTGDVVINQVDGLIQLFPGIIGHAGTSGTYSGQVLVNGWSGINLAGVAGNPVNPTIGFSGGTTVTSPQIQVFATDGITLTAATGVDATVGVRNATGSATVGKLNVSSQNGDVVVTTASTGNAVIGHLSAGASLVTISELGVASTLGNITLAGSTIGGTALVGTVNTNATTQSQIAVNAPVGALSLTGAGSGGPVGRALIATNQLGSSVPVDLSVNVGKAILSGSPVSGSTSGIAELFAGRNINYVSSGDLQLTANSGSSAISNVNGLMTFSVGGNLGVLAGSGPAQIGNLNPANGLASSILFTTIGSNARLQGGTVVGAYARIGHAGTAGANPLTGNVQINEVGGTLTLAAGSATDTQAQIGSYSSINSTISGDVMVSGISGSLNLTGGSALRASAVVGHGGTGPGTIYTGQVLAQAARVSLQGGSAASASATIGFDDTSGSPTVNSTQVQVSAPTSISLKAGTLGNAVVGCYSPTATGNVVIGNVNVLSINGDIILNPGAGADAVIGTRLLAGTSRSNIKLATSGDIRLENPVGSAGKALIVNNRSGASGSTNISLDPANIILLSGTGAPGLVQIYSGNNLDINFTNRLDLNYDANNPGTLQTGTAQILASGDITINTVQTSTGNLTMQGPSTAGQTTEITSANGNVMVGLADAPGIQNLNLGTGAAGILGVAKIGATNGDLCIHVSRTAMVRGSASAQAQVLAGQTLMLNADRNITMDTNSLIQNTAIFPLSLYAGNNIEMGGAAPSAKVQSPGLMSVQAVHDVELSFGAQILGTGNDPLQVIAGNNASLDDTSLIQSVGFVSVQAGRDVSLASSAQVKGTGSDDAELTAGNNVTLSNSAILSQTGTGSVTAVAGRNLLLQNTARVTTVNNNLTLVADNLWPDSDKFGPGFLSIDAGVTVTSGTAITRLFSSRRPFNTISAPINGSAYVQGPIYVNSPTEQWEVYWDKAFGTGVPFVFFFKDTAPPTGPVNCVNVCNFPTCFNLCNPIPPSPPSPPSPPCPPCPPHHHPAPKTPHLTNRLILDRFEDSLFEAFQDWRHYDDFLFTALPLAMNSACCDYLKLLYPSRDVAASCEELMANIGPFGTASSCQEEGQRDLGVLRPEHRNYHTKKLEIIQ